MKKGKMKGNYWDNNLGSKTKGEDSLTVKKPFMKLTWKEIAQDVKSIRTGKDKNSPVTRK